MSAATQFDCPALETSLGRQLFQGGRIKTWDRPPGGLGQLGHGRHAGLVQFLDLPHRNVGHADEVIPLFEEPLGMRGPLVMIGSRQRFGTILQAAGEPVLHQHELLAHMPIEVDEIFEPELHPFLRAKDDSETSRRLGTGHVGQHVGVAAELNRIQGLG